MKSKEQGESEIVINSVAEAKIIIGNAKAAQEQHFDALIRLIERLEIEIDMLRRENE